MARARILVVEDNAPDVLLTAEALREEGLEFELTHIRDGDEAFAKLSAYQGAAAPFDLVILDINLPRVGGFEVLSWLRKNTAADGIPIFVLTSSFAAHEHEEARRLGADIYLTKAPDLHEFLRSVGQTARKLLQNERRTAKA